MLTRDDLITLDPVDQLDPDRRVHADLTIRTDEEIQSELSWLRVLNFFTTSAWHRRREERIAAELRDRRQARRAHYRRTAPESGR